MLKAKALCAVKGNPDPEVRPLISAVNNAERSMDKTSCSLHSIFNCKQNLIIESVGGDDQIPEAVFNLAVRMMKSNDLIKDLMHELRQLFIRGCKDFSLSLTEYSDTQRAEIIALFQDMAGLIRNVRYNSQYHALTGSLLSMPKAQMFLTGQYLELAVYQTIKDVIQELAVKYHTEYDIYRNVRVADRNGQIKNEFDIAFQFDGAWYIVECKTGKCFNEWESLYKHGVIYDVIPHHLLLVDAAISSNWASQIEYFCDYMVCNLSNNSLEEKITKMIRYDMAA